VRVDVVVFGKRRNVKLTDQRTHLLGKPLAPLVEQDTSVDLMCGTTPLDRILGDVIDNHGLAFEGAVPCDLSPEHSGPEHSGAVED